MPESAIQIESRPLSHAVLEDLTQRIVRGHLQVGQTLPTEPALAEQYNVSRTVIRDAVRLLVERGLVIVRQGSGMRVRSADAWDHLDPLVLFEQVRSGEGGPLLDEILEVRRLVETQAARWAAQRRDADDLAALQALLRDMRANLDDPHAFTTVDVAFHEAIMRAAKNRVLRDTLRPIAAALRTGRFLTSERAGGVAESMRGHQEISAAISQQDPQGAEQAMHNHLTQFEHDIRARLTHL